MQQVTMVAFVCVLSTLFAAVHVNAQVAAAASTCGACVPRHKYDADRHQITYKVGVLNFRGPDSAFAQHNATFAAYLSATAGQRFDPPIRFEMKPVDFSSMFTDAENGLVDFVYLSPSPFACVEAEYGAQSLVSHISKRTVGGNTYTLEKFGGVIATRFDNDAVNSIQDLKGKVVASAAISSFGGGQMQFREVQTAGLSYINDPKQLVFTGNQGQIVNGVIDGKFDVGFIRTDQIQRTKDQYDNLVDPALLKILEPKDNVLNGAPFPFVASTQLYPEWNLAAMDFVASDVSREVQYAMLSLAEHAKAGEAIQACLDANTTVAVCNDLDKVVPEERRFDTTIEIAAIAKQAMTNGGYAGFRTTQSYIEIRAMLQDTSFISKDEETNTWKCARPSKLYEAIVCPPGHFKKSKEDVESGCFKAGLECSEEHQCVCNPCQKSFDVDIFPIEENTERAAGCPKMSLCGSTAQTESLDYRAIDNMKRIGATMNVTVREGDLEARQVHVIHDPFSNEYEFSVSANRIGILILEIFLNGVQVPESPLRVQIEERQCDDSMKEADNEGSCVCMANQITIGDSCMPYGILAAIVLAPFGFLFLVGVWWYVEKKKREADAIWHVKAEDLHFGSPREIIGAGAFGLVLLAEYRGTQVAVKRALPPRPTGNGKAKGVMFDDGEDDSDNSICDTANLSKTSGNRSGVFKNNRTALAAIPSESATVEQFKNAAAAPFEDLEVQTARSSQSHNSRSKTIGMSSGHYANSITSSGTRSMLKSALVTNTTGGSKGGGKMFNLRSSTGLSRQKQEFMAEMRLLSKLRHPCITTVMGAVISQKEDPMLVMEYCCHGSLHDILHNETMIIEGDLVHNILSDIASGVRFLHAAQPAVIHGDIKSANILIDSRFRAKVSDFGLATKKAEVATGSPYFMAPELLRGDCANSVESDMYAFGIILYELYSRKDPYEGEDSQEVLQLVCDKSINKRPPAPKACPPVVIKLMKQLLSASTTSRPSASELDNRLKALDASTVAPLLSAAELKRKQETSDAASRNDFLYKVFPRHIADILASGGKPEPETHEIVTIFFSDIVGFTNISSSFSAIKVSDMLDRLYHAFDDLAEKHEVFKLETIGDAYLAVSNLTEDQSEDHVKRIAEFAVEVVKAASEVPIDKDDPSKGYVNIRVGFHSGAVVSNVVGNLNPRFGLFGDTINVASRMESTSIEGRIHCSDRSAQLLMAQAPDIPVKLRGETTVKGKGAMKTYWVH